MIKLASIIAISFILAIAISKKENCFTEIKLNNNTNIIDSNILLKLKKNSNGVLVEYPPQCTLQIMHPLYSDVVFPETSVAIVSKKKTVVSKYFSNGDSIYILPLIGISNNLHVYCINFNDCNISSKNYDIRTVFPYVWVDAQTNRFITAELSVDADKFKYKFILYEINSNDVSRVSVKSLETNYDIYNDFPAQDSICKSLFDL